MRYPHTMAFRYSDDLKIALENRCRERGIRRSEAICGILERELLAPPTQEAQPQEH